MGWGEGCEGEGEGGDHQARAQRLGVGGWGGGLSQTLGVQDLKDPGQKLRVNRHWFHARVQKPGDGWEEGQPMSQSLV